MTLAKVLFSLQGRISRGTFWAVCLALFAMNCIVGILVRAVGPVLVVALGEGVAWAFLCLWLAVCTWVGLATQVKRWHDMGRSGWMVLLNLVPAIGHLVSLVWLGSVKGTKGPNRYGDEPQPGDMFVTADGKNVHLHLHASSARCSSSGDSATG